MSQQKSRDMVKKCATAVWQRNGEIYGKKQLRACFEGLVSSPRRYPKLFDLELDHVYVRAKICWAHPQKADAIADLLHLEPVLVQALLDDLLTFDLGERDGVGEYLPTGAGEQFIVDLVLDTLETERQVSFPGHKDSIRWYEGYQGLDPKKGSERKSGIVL